MGKGERHQKVQQLQVSNFSFFFFFFSSVDLKQLNSKEAGILGFQEDLSLELQDSISKLGITCSK